MPELGTNHVFLTTSTHSQQRCPPPLFIRNWYKSWSLLFSMSFCPPQSVFLRLSCMQDCTFRRLINHRVPQISARHTYPYQSQKSCTINQLRAQHALEHLQKPGDFVGRMAPISASCGYCPILWRESDITSSYMRFSSYLVCTKGLASPG